jgi:hypothetical protein
MKNGLHYALKQRIKHGAVKLNELRPNSRAIAERLLAAGEIYRDSNGFLRSNEA